MKKFQNKQFDRYQSPFSWRYGSEAMRHIFSEQHKYELWRSIWIALAKVEHRAGLVSIKELDDLIAHEKEIDIDRILELEKETKHDVVAAIKEFAEHCPIGGGKIHFGATSMDISDNAEMIKLQEAMEMVEKLLLDTLRQFSLQMEKTATVVCMGFTHLQPAEPTTVGYRLAFYAQDLLTDLNTLRFVRHTIRGKGLKGAVGTRASYQAILAEATMTPEQLDTMVMNELGIDASEISSQVYSRKYDYLVISALASIASSCAKFASDLRILQSPLYGEWSEPFQAKQVGSSAMPFKKNPVNSEKICSLARYVIQLPPVLLENATLSHLERTLDDSANRRIVLSEACLAIDEILHTTQMIISGLQFHTERIQYNLNQFGPFAASEPLLIGLVKNGADRQDMHELLRTVAMKAWDAVQQGKVNPMKELLSNNKIIHQYMNKKELETVLDISHHIGDASLRVKKIIERISDL